MTKSAQTQVKFSGRLSYRLRGLLNLMRCSTLVLLRRAVRGPKLPDWTLTLEMGTEFVRSQNEVAFKMASIADAREYEDAVYFSLPAEAKVDIEPESGGVRGHWFTPRAGADETVVLYLHGGGYAYYSRSHASFIAQAAVACQARTFALDYRLAPEHPYPAQLEDAVAAYRWLLDTGNHADNIIVMGDSAGGNLVLALLLQLRELGLPQPSGAVPLCPWTDVGNLVSPYEAMEEHDEFDFPQSQMVPLWGGWFCGSANFEDPLISPLFADLTGLPPIYIQAGGKEILFDQIERFVQRAQRDGVNVRLDTWPTMNHDFQIYGDEMPQSKEAWQRIASFVEECVDCESVVSLP